MSRVFCEKNVRMKKNLRARKFIIKNYGKDSKKARKNQIPIKKRYL